MASGLGAWLVGLLAVGATEAAPPSLEAARRQEAQVLRQERDGLQRALQESRTSADKAQRALEADIDRLGAELVQLEADNAGLEQSLPARERARSHDAQDRHLGDLMSQMSSWLQLQGSDPLPHAGPEHLAPLVEAVLNRARHDGSLRSESGAGYFTGTGKPATGTVLHIGNVAAVLTDDGTPLVHTAEGLYQVDGFEGGMGRAGQGTRVSVVLQDPNATVDSHAFVDAGWRGHMETGGPLMWVLFAFACLAGLVALERTIVLAVVAARWRAAVQRVEALRNVQPQPRREQLAQESGVVSRPMVVVAEAHPAHNVEERATQALIVLRELLFRRLSLLSICAAVAPLTGLLGTVTGMIGTFSVVTTNGTSDPQLLAGGISEALLTTQFGLAIAIPTVIVHALLGRGARRVLASAEQTVLRHIHGLAAPGESGVWPKVESSAPPASADVEPESEARPLTAVVDDG